MTNGNLPSELKSASPLDVVNYCIYLMNDLHVLTESPYLLADLFFKNMFLLKAPIEIQEKY